MDKQQLELVAKAAWSRSFWRDPCGVAQRCADLKANDVARLTEELRMARDEALQTDLAVARLEER